MKKKRGIALVLGGGGVRALSHAGVLRVLVREKIRISHISGTSMGAVIGAMFSLNPDPETLIERWHEFTESDVYDDTGLGYFRKKGSGGEDDGFFQDIADKVRGRLIINLAQSRRSIVKGKRLNRGLEFLIGDRDFSECKIPLSVVATDLYTGNAVTFEEGSILSAVEASSSIPGFLPPVKWGDCLLTDGAVSTPVPVQQAIDSGIKPVVAVGAKRELKGRSHLTNVWEILTKADVITVSLYGDLLMRDADVVIVTRGENAHWSEFSKIDGFVKCGEEAALESVPEIRKAIDKQSWWGRLFN